MRRVLLLLLFVLDLSCIRILVLVFVMDLVTTQQLVEKVSALENQVAVQQRLVGRPKARLPDPEKLAGATRYDTWLPLIRAKLRIDADAIGTDEAQFFYLYGNLDSKIQAMVLPQLLQAETNEFWDYQTILDQLERVYDNPTKRDTAAARLQGIRQGNDALSVYLSKFERVLHEANANSWPDDSKIAILRNGVNDKLLRVGRCPAVQTAHILPTTLPTSSGLQPAVAFLSTTQYHHHSFRCLRSCCCAQQVMSPLFFSAAI